MEDAEIILHKRRPSCRRYSGVFSSGTGMA